jgi:hypothetical protein
MKIQYILGIFILLTPGLCFFSSYENNDTQAKKVDNPSKETLFMGGIEPGTTPQIKFDRKIKAEYKKFSKIYRGSYGLSASTVDINSGNVWIVAMGDGKGQGDVATAGFETEYLENSGATPEPNVTVTAEIYVRINKGKFALCLQVHRRQHGMVNILWKEINQPGSHKITSKPFTMQTNSKYYAISYIINEAPPKDKIRAVIAKFKDIIWTY